MASTYPCKGVCGFKDCFLVFQNELDYFLHKSNEGNNSFTASDQLLCKKCLALYEDDERQEDHKCKPILDTEVLHNLSLSESTIIESLQSPLMIDSTDTRGDNCNIECCKSPYLQSELELISPTQSLMPLSLLKFSTPKLDALNTKNEATSHLNEAYEVNSNLNQLPNSSNNAASNLNNCIALFWDIENISIPLNKSPSGVVKALRNKFLVHNAKEVEFQCVCDTHKEDRTIIDQLNSSMVTIVHVTCTVKNAADEKLKQILQKFSQTYSAPATLVLLSGDVNFAPILSNFKNYHKYHVILVHNLQCSQALKDTASEVYLFDDIIKNVESPIHNIRSNNHTFLLAFGLPVASTRNIRNELDKLCDNTGGRVVNVQDATALIRFQSQENAARAQKRLHNQVIYGRKITVKFAPDPGLNIYPPQPGANILPRRDIPYYPTPPQPRFPNRQEICRPQSNPLYPQKRLQGPSVINATCYSFRLRIFPPHLSSKWEVINRSRIEPILNYVGGLATMMNFIPLIDCASIEFKSNLTAQKLIETIQNGNFNLVKVDICVMSKIELDFEKFIAESYLILSHSSHGWLYVAEFRRAYFDKFNCGIPELSLLRLWSLNKGVVCGIEDESPEKSVLVIQDCDPRHNYSINITDNMNLRKMIINILRVPKYKGKIHLYDFLSIFRQFYGEKHPLPVCRDNTGLKVFSILNKVPDISITNFSKCKSEIMLKRQLVTPANEYNYHLHLIKQLLIEKSDYLKFETIRDVTQKTFHMKFIMSDKYSAIRTYEELMTAIKDLYYEVTIHFNIFFKFGKKLLSISHQLGRLARTINSRKIQLTTDTLLGEYKYRNRSNLNYNQFNIKSPIDLIKCIPFFGLYNSYQNSNALALDNYYHLEQTTKECLEIISSYSEQRLPLDKFKSEFEQTVGFTLDIPLSDMPQILISGQEVAEPNVYISINYFAMEISNMLYKEPKYQVTLDLFSQTYFKLYNKKINPSTYNSASLINLIDMLADYIYLKDGVIFLQHHRVFAAEVIIMLRERTVVNQNILISNFHSLYSKYFGKEFKLDTFKASNLLTLLNQLHDVVTVGGPKDCKHLKLTPLARFCPDLPQVNCKPFNLGFDFQKSKISTSVVETPSKRTFIRNLEMAIYNQVNKSTPISSFDKLYFSIYNESIPYHLYPGMTLIDITNSYYERINIRDEGNNPIIRLLPERIFACECRKILECYIHGINMSGFPNTYSEVFMGKHFDLSVYCNYKQLHCLVEKVGDVVKLIGPYKSWMVSAENNTKLIELTNHIDLIFLGDILIEILQFNSVSNCISFDNLPNSYKEYYKRDTPEWINILANSDYIALQKMYVKFLVDEINRALQIKTTEKRVNIMLSSEHLMATFRKNLICLFHQLNKSLLDLQTLVDCYQSKFGTIMYQNFGFQSIQDLLMSCDVVTISMIDFKVVLNPAGMCSLFRLQLVEMLYLAENHSILQEDLTSKFYSLYGYNFKLSDLNIHKLNDFLTDPSIMKLYQLTGEGTLKRLTLKFNELFQEDCRRLLTFLYEDNRLPIAISEFCQLYKDNIGQDCTIEKISLAKEIVHITGYRDSLKISLKPHVFIFRNPTQIEKTLNPLRLSDFVTQIQTTDNFTELVKSTQPMMDNQNEGATISSDDTAALTASDESITVQNRNFRVAANFSSLFTEENDA